MCALGPLGLPSIHLARSFLLFRLRGKLSVPHRDMHSYQVPTHICRAQKQAKKKKLRLQGLQRDPLGALIDHIFPGCYYTEDRPRCPHTAAAAASKTKCV